jgi:hypothetical protein
VVGRRKNDPQMTQMAADKEGVARIVAKMNHVFLFICGHLRHLRISFLLRRRGWRGTIATGVERVVLGARSGGPYKRHFRWRL